MIVSAILAAAVATDAPPTRAVATSETAQRSLKLGSGGMFELAERAVAQGRAALAESLYSALERDPDENVRNEARYRRSKLLAADGRQREAASLLRRILEEKPDAGRVRLELAALLHALGDTDGAWRQLRALQAAGLPPALARMVDRYSEALRTQRPFGFSFGIALAPDSNINHATSSDSLGTVFGDFEIDEESKAKSGLGVAVNGQAFRRFPMGNHSRNFLVRLSGLANFYGKSQFNNAALDFAAGPELQLGGNRINLELGTTQRWFGQDPSVRSARIGATLVRPLDRRSQLRVSASAALVDNQINDLQDGKAYSGEVRAERALTPSTGFGINASAMREQLDEPGYSTKSWRLGMLGWHDLGRMTITAEAQWGRLHADERLSLFPEKRRDLYSRVSVGGTFRQLSFEGFAPVARIVTERNRSSIAFYDYKRTRTELGVERAF